MNITMMSGMIIPDTWFGSFVQGIKLSQVHCLCQIYLMRLYDQVLVLILIHL